jgi:hypothetical protein
MTKDITSNCVYFINETERAEDGGYIPCIAVEGERGYYKTDWNWSSNLELANQIAAEKNAALGFTPKEALLIVLGTMKGI